MDFSALALAAPAPVASPPPTSVAAASSVQFPSALPSALPGVGGGDDDVAEEGCGGERRRLGGGGWFALNADLVLEPELN